METEEEKEAEAEMMKMKNNPAGVVMLLDG